ncbi:MAG: hydrogenase large subunit [Thermoleophilia bacterium]
MTETRHETISRKYLPRNAAVESHGNLIACEVPAAEIAAVCESLYDHHELPLMIITCFDERDRSGFFRIMYVFGVPGENLFLGLWIEVLGEFPSLTPRIHEASIHERRIKTFFGLEPVGHPNPRPLILHENWPADAFPLRKDFDWKTRPPEAEGSFRFRELGGEGIYEIPVGPVHAGIIEPGHFRFSVAGEEILLLEPRLGYSHKGSEKLFEVLPQADKLRLAERISGDSSFSHALAFCLALESLAGISVPESDNRHRVVFSELERLANHIGDIGAIMTDTGFNFGGAAGARLREAVMQINERLTGSRFLRGVAKLGGTNARLKPETIRRLPAELDALEKDFDDVLAVAESSNTLINRLEGTGILPLAIARDHGVRGIPARAVGLRADARVDYPYCAYGKISLDVATEDDGDVLARFRVRVAEVHASIAILKEMLGSLDNVSGHTGKSPGHEEDATGATHEPTEPLNADYRKNSFAVSVVEGWRGSIVYLVATDSNGEISRVAVCDPSFLNWTALGYAGQENMVPDFPLINKSFNLSYSGNDL